MDCGKEFGEPFICSYLILSRLASPPLNKRLQIHVPPPQLLLIDPLLIAPQIGKLHYKSRNGGLHVLIYQLRLPALRLSQQASLSSRRVTNASRICSPIAASDENCKLVSCSLSFWRRSERIPCRELLMYVSREVVGGRSNLCREIGRAHV